VLWAEPMLSVRPPTRSHARDSPRTLFNYKTPNTMTNDKSLPIPRSILFQNKARTVALLDLPTSLEESQRPSCRAAGERRRLISHAAPKVPYETPEPKSRGHDSPPGGSSSAQVAQLMIQGTVDSALDELKKTYSGPWCLPRIAALDHGHRPLLGQGTGGGPAGGTVRSAPTAAESASAANCFIPERSRYLLGTIEAERASLLSAAPQFDLIVLDPPWPNRSARRKRGIDGYRTADDLHETRGLLSRIPVAASLAPHGIVAVWVTNKQAFVELLCSAGGILDQWGLQLVQETIWVKIAANGEPVFPVDSRWRKPWERLLIARPKGSHHHHHNNSNNSHHASGGRFPKVVVAVPELHSRKPNLRYLFEQAGLPEGYMGLEVFARNLTAGWWSWGQEVLLFQGSTHWIVEEED
jgi:N6-adenosine-specific RNA methylase IME4